MLTARVERRKTGYAQKKGTVWLPYQKKRVEKRLELRVDGGYIRDWKKRPGGRKVYLRYREDGKPSRRERKRVSKPSREVSMSYQGRWMRTEEMGMYIVATSKGRITSTEARKKKRGGRLRRWVR